MPKANIYNQIWNLFFSLFLIGIGYSVHAQRAMDAIVRPTPVQNPKDSIIKPFEDYTKCYTGFINGLGDTIHQAKFDLVKQLRLFNKWHYLVRQDMKWGLLDHKGNQLIECKYETLLYQNLPNQWQYGQVSKYASEKCQRSIANRGFFPMFSVWQNGKCGIVDYKDQIKVALKYLNVTPSIWLDSSWRPTLVFYTQSEPLTHRNYNNFTQQYDAIRDSLGELIFTSPLSYYEPMHVVDNNCKLKLYLAVNKYDDNDSFTRKLYNIEDFNSPPLEGDEFECFSDFINAVTVSRKRGTNDTSQIFNLDFEPLTPKFKGRTIVLNSNGREANQPLNKDKKYLLHYAFKTSSPHFDRKFYSYFSDFEGNTLIKERYGQGSVEYTSDSTFFVRFYQTKKGRDGKNERYYFYAFHPDGSKIIGGLYDVARFEKESLVPHFTLNKKGKQEYWLDLKGKTYFKKGKYVRIQETDCQDSLGVYRVVSQDLKTGYVDINEKELIPLKYQSVSSDKSFLTHFAMYKHDSMDLYDSQFTILYRGIKHIETGHALDSLFKRTRRGCKFIVRGNKLYQKSKRVEVLMDSTSFSFKNNYEVVNNHFIVNKKGILINTQFHVTEHKQYFITNTRNGRHQELIFKKDPEKNIRTVRRVKLISEDIILITLPNQHRELYNFKTGSSVEFVHEVIYDYKNDRYWHATEEIKQILNKWVVKNSNDSLLSPLIFDVPLKCHLPIQTYLRDGKFGLIGNDLSILLPAKYDKIIKHQESDTTYGFAIFKKEQGWGYFNSKKEFLKPKFSGVSFVDQSDLMFVFANDSSGKVALINSSFDLLIPFSSKSEIAKNKSLTSLFEVTDINFYMKKTYDTTNAAHIEYFVKTLLSTAFHNRVEYGHEYSKVYVLNSNWHLPDTYPPGSNHDQRSITISTNYFSKYYASADSNYYWHKQYGASPQHSTVLNYSFTSSGIHLLKRNEIFRPDKGALLESILLKRINRDQLFGLNCVNINQHIETFKSRYKLVYGGIQFELGPNYNDKKIFLTSEEL
ncbi:MAG: hypothetical protein ACI9J3_003635, partial [Parvicellaceae bacterium]